MVRHVAVEQLVDLNLAERFAATPTTLGLCALLVLVIAAWLMLLVTQVGRDREAEGRVGDAAVVPLAGGRMALGWSGVGEAPPLPDPPEGLRPAQLGVLFEEFAQPLHIAATLVDLAARGHLTLSELPRAGLRQRRDWVLARQAAAEAADAGPDPSDAARLGLRHEWPAADARRRGAPAGGHQEGDLLSYERLLLRDLFVSGPEVRLSRMRPQLTADLVQVREAIYQDAAERGWYDGRPDQVRARWRRHADIALVVGLAATGALAWWSTFGLVGLPLVAGAVALHGVARYLPRRTPKGTALLRLAAGFRRFVVDCEAHQGELVQHPWRFSEHCGHALAFRALPAWGRAFAGAEAAVIAPAWYHAPAPFRPASFTAALEDFTAATLAVLGPAGRD